MSEIEEAVKKVHEVREKGTADEIKAAAEHLERASHKAAEEMYKTAGAQPDGAAPVPAARSDAAARGRRRRRTTSSTPSTSRSDSAAQLN